jgi:hypothetical protein
MTHVTHHARVAWDGAMAFVGAAAYDDLYGWLDERLGDLLGAPARQALYETRVRLSYSRRPDVQQVESGRWRARLEDILDTDPAVSGPLRSLIHDTRLRLRELQPTGLLRRA